MSTDSGSAPRKPRGWAREETLETLRRRIITLELPPGAALSENELSTELGVSRTPVRESLILLRGEGLVQVYPQVGTFVSLVDPDRVTQAQFIREAIECASLESVELPLAAEDAAMLADVLARQEEAVESQDRNAFFELDEEYHRTLLRIADHESAWETVTAQKAHLDRARRLSLVDTRPLSALLDQHRSVVDSLVAGDTSAAVAHLRTHLRAVFDDVAAIRASRPELFSDSATARPVRRTLSQLR